MGDGYFTSPGVLKLCTDNFTKDEVLSLIRVLYVNFGIVATINKRVNSDNQIKWRIRISKASMPLLISLVKPHIISEMLYKLGI